MGDGNKKGLRKNVKKKKNRRKNDERKEVEEPVGKQSVLTRSKKGKLRMVPHDT